VKRIQMAASAAQTAHTAKKEAESQYKVAIKQATTVYARDKEKTDGKLAQHVVNLIAKEFKVNLSARTIQMKVKNGEISTSPVRRGPKGGIPEYHYTGIFSWHLSPSFESAK
jgi:hypothetical protein